jgi:hypothetical protein
MSDVTEAPTQDAIAESLLPESEQQQAEQTVTEQPVEEQVQEQPQEQEQQAQVEETADDWLPTEQDKVFPDEVISRYAERMGLNPDLVQEPTVRQLLVNKLNTDIYLQQQEELAAPVEEQQPAPQTEPQISREQYFQNLENVIRQRTDPQVANDFYSGFMRVFGVPDAEIAKLAPSQALPFTHLASKYMLNAVNTFLPDMLQANLTQVLSQAYPGFGDMYNRSAHALAWDRVRNSSPQFAQLPAYGTKEFSQKLREAANRVPEVAEMIDEADGKPMNQQQVARWYGLLARVASGQNVNPQLLQQAAAAGARNARRADVRRAAGNLGSGQSKGASQSQPSSRFETNSDLFDENTMDLYEREHGRL